MTEEEREERFLDAAAKLTDALVEMYEAVEGDEIALGEYLYEANTLAAPPYAREAA